MQATVEIQVQPIGSGASNRDEIERAVEVLREIGFETKTHAMGTEVEGELSRVLEAVERIHEQLHEDGTPRITTSVSIHTRVK